MIDRKKFYDTVRFHPFNNFHQSQVDGLNFILDTWEKDWQDKIPVQQFAYVLATVFHETAATMQPIEEYGKGRGHPYGVPDRITGKVYDGRGYVQLTWKRNYELASQKIGVDFVNNPDLVMQPEHAIVILFKGMLEGWFTGKKLSDFQHQGLHDYFNARRIINGTDRALLIEGYAISFNTALK